MIEILQVIAVIITLLVACLFFPLLFLGLLDMMIFDDLLSEKLKERVKRTKLFSGGKDEEREDEKNDD